MMDVERSLRVAIQRLDAAHLRWCIVGGIAVSARTVARFTSDVDIALAVASDQEAEAIVHQMMGQGYQALAIIEQEATERMSTVRLLEPGAQPDGVVLDLLFASSGIEPELVAEAEPIQVFVDLIAPIPRLGHLIALKLLSESDRRLKDRMDLQALFAVADADELARARAGLALITARGFDRGKDLPTLLAQWTASERPDLLS
jgi:predicted nucleotidyltransferase